MMAEAHAHTAQHTSPLRLRQELARELGSGVLQAIYRLIKSVQIHALDNEAVRRQSAATHEALADYERRSGRPFTMLFLRGAVFVAAQPLKASRSVYEQATELAAAFERCGAVEITLRGECSADLLRDWAAAIVSAQRGGRYDAPRGSRDLIALHGIDAAAATRGLEIEILDDEQRIVRTYASAIVLLRRVLEQVEAGELALPRRIKHVAQSLVDLSAGKTPAFLGVTAVRNANHDDAGKAVNSAILAVAMARQITEDRVALARIAMAAMLQDVGRPRATRLLRLDTDDTTAPRMAVRLDEQAERALPAGTAAVLTCAGRINDPTMVRAVVAFESLWLARQRRLGPVYRGLRPPTLHARIVAMARRFNELLTPAPGEPARTASDALLELDAEVSAAPGTGKSILGDNVDRTVLRLLIGALGVLPPGTLVELSSGETAVVVSSGAAGDPTGLTLRVVLDETGAMPDRAVDFSLADGDRRIVKISGSDPSFVRRVDAGSTPLSSAHLSVAPAAPTPAASTPIATTARPKITELAHLEEDEPISSAPLSPSPPLPPSAPSSDVPSRPKFLDDIPAPSAKSIPAERKADVTGPLSTTPVPFLLVHMLGRSLTGTLVISHPGRATSRVSFVEGAPLGESPEETVAQLTVLAELPEDGSYAFYAGIPKEEGVRCEPLAVVLAVVRAWSQTPSGAARVESTLKKLGDRIVALHPASDVTRFGLRPSEATVLDAAHEFDLPYTSLVEAEVADPSTVRALVYTLAVTRHLDLGVEAWPMGVGTSASVPAKPNPALGSVSTTRANPALGAISTRPIPIAEVRATQPTSEVFRASLSPPAPPVAQKPLAPPSLPPAQRQTVLDRAKTIADDDHYAVLGIERDAADYEVEQAFFKLAKQFHPDRQAADLKEPAAMIFARIREAHTTLSDVHKRVEYDEALARGPTASSSADAEEVQRVLQASTEAQKADVLLRRGDLAGAQKLAEHAVQLDPEQPEHRLVLAWIRVQRATDNAGLVEPLQMLETVVQLEGNNDRALLYRGTVLKRLGRHTEAIRDFRAAAELNPKNVDAVREVRLHQMRTEAKEAEKQADKKGGLRGFFKK
jgi:tetratricopeptide (TPR) repeat protein